MTDTLFSLQYAIDKARVLHAGTTALSAILPAEIDPETDCQMDIILQDLNSQQIISRDSFSGKWPISCEFKWTIPANTQKDGGSYRLKAILSFSDQSPSLEVVKAISYIGWNKCFRNNWSYNFKGKMSSEGAAECQVTDVAFYFTPIKDIVVYSAEDISVEYTSTSGKVPYKGRIFMDLDKIRYCLGPILNASFQGGLANIEFSCLLTYGLKSDPEHKETSTILIQTQKK